MEEWIRGIVPEESVMSSEPMASALMRHGEFARDEFERAYGPRAQDREEFGLRFAVSLGACAAKEIAAAGSFELDNENKVLAGLLARFAQGAFALRGDDFCVALSVLKNELPQKVSEWRVEHGEKVFLSVKAKKRIATLLRACEHYDDEKRCELIDALSDSVEGWASLRLDVFEMLEKKGELARALMLKAELGRVANQGVSGRRARSL